MVNQRRTYDDGFMRVSLGRREVIIKGKKVDLTTLEWRLFAVLIQNVDHSVSTELCMAAMYRETNGFSTYLAKWHMSNLRKKLRDASGGEAPIETIVGFGYRYNRKGEVEICPLCGFANGAPL